VPGDRESQGRRATRDAEAQAKAATDAARKWSMTIAARSEAEAAAGRGREAVLLALEALPKPFDASSRLLVQPAIAAVRQALHVPRKRLRLLHRDAVLSAAFSPNRSRLVTGAEDKTARVWEAGSGDELLLTPEATRTALVGADAVQSEQVEYPGRHLGKQRAKGQSGTLRRSTAAGGRPRVPADPRGAEARALIGAFTSGRVG
jgi:hypothetical protein